MFIHAVENLVTTMLAIPRHAVQHARMATAHAISSQASGVGKSVVLVVMRVRNLVRERDLRKRVLCGHDRCALRGVSGRLAFTLGNSSGFTSSLDSLVAVLVVRSKVLKELTICFRHIIA